MEDHFQKSQDDFGSLTEQIIFKGGVQNNNNNNLDNNSQAINNENKIYSIEKKHDDLLSFRKGGKKSGYDIEALCEKVSNLLINHEIEQNKIEKEKKTDFKKMFMKTTEKELEIFESERLIKKESFENINEKENNEDIIENENNEDNKLNINSNDNDNEKCLSQVICTLSKIEGGYATFVSSNDLIFVLPSLFIPKDLNPGSSYIFELCELEYAENKINQVNKIHKMYSKDLVEEINDKNNDEKD
jgi:hypothetical protein